jgi:peptide-methionine (R)-S-oxide reductase
MQFPATWRVDTANTKVQWTPRTVARILVHMRSRRQLLFLAGAALGFSSALGCLDNPGGREAQMTTKTQFPVERTDDQWRDTLSAEQYKVLREHGTERAFTSPLNNEKRQGTFLCAACGQLLFSSDTKYDSGTGWPSFYKPLDGAVGTTIDRSWFTERTEVHCARCGGHLGHVFPDGPPPTGQRYCMNGVAMRFEPKQ